VKKFTVIDARIVIEGPDDMEDDELASELRSLLATERLFPDDILVTEFGYSHIIMETNGDGPVVSIHEELPEP
jgi:hypothetical protein